jgi:hypothetical protein
MGDKPSSSITATGSTTVSSSNNSTSVLLGASHGTGADGNLPSVLASARLYGSSASPARSGKVPHSTCDDGKRSNSSKSGSSLGLDVDLYKWRSSRHVVAWQEHFRVLCSDVQYVLGYQHPASTDMLVAAAVVDAQSDWEMHSSMLSGLLEFLSNNFLWCFNSFLMSHCVTSGLVTKQYITRAAAKVHLIMPECDPGSPVSSQQLQRGVEARIPDQLCLPAAAAPPFGNVHSSNGAGSSNSTDNEISMDMIRSRGLLSTLQKPEMFPGGSPIERPSILALRFASTPSPPSSPQVLPLLMRGKRKVEWYGSVGELAAAIQSTGPSQGRLPCVRPDSSPASNGRAGFAAGSIEASLTWGSTTCCQAWVLGIFAAIVPGQHLVGIMLLMLLLAALVW